MLLGVKTLKRVWVVVNSKNHYMTEFTLEKRSTFMFFQGFSASII